MRMKFLIFFVILWFSAFLYVSVCQGSDAYEGKIVKGNRNALYLVEKGKKRLFPDFYTYSKMGFTAEHVMKIPDKDLESIALGQAITPIPVFRPEDRMYHSHCEDPDKMVNDLGVVSNLGDISRFSNVYNRIKQTGKMDMVLLGGSITAGGYFLEFVRNLENNRNITVTYHNHGHGATEITYSIFCVDIDKYQPDVILIDFSVNDYGHPKLMESLIRKALSLPSQPVVAIVNLWVQKDCPTPRYLLHSYYYQLPLLNVCPAVNLCYGKGQLPKSISDQYSKTDGVHPWGSQGVKFLGELLYAWWKRLETLLTQDVSMDVDGKLTAHTHSFQVHNGKEDIAKGLVALPTPIYTHNPIGLCTRCEALADDADGKLAPVSPPKGFRIVTRSKIGYGGFTSHQQHHHRHSGATKSFKRSWQASEPGSEISFRFYGTTVKIAIWQRRDGMGILHAFIDNNRQRIVKVSSFFKGYTWAMERNNTGRSEIMPLFEGLSDDYHTLTLVVANEPANPWVPGHLVQVFALLSASDKTDCKGKL